MSWRSLSLLAAAAIITMTGCERDISGLDPVPPDTDPVVFKDGFGSGVDYQAFLGSKLDAVAVDLNEKYAGTASLRLTIPGPNSPDGGYAGGAFTTSRARDLSSYNALTFWAKASKTSTFDVVGFGNNNTGKSRYTAQWNGVPLTTTWTKFVVPIPLPEKLHLEDGLFFVAEAPEGSEGHEVWFDEVRFEYVEGISDPRPAMRSQVLDSFAGESVTISNTQVTFNVNGVDRTIEHMPGYFTFFSSDSDVVRVDGEEILVVGAGTAQITASLGDVDAVGMVTVNATAPPATPAPEPTQSAANVISLFSDAFDDVPVDTWSATWDAADVSDILVQSDNVKVYTNLSFAGIEFTSEPIGATEMEFLHVDVWVPQGNLIRIKLVDFGADGTYQGEPDSESEVTVDRREILRSASAPGFRWTFRWRSFRD